MKKQVKINKNLSLVSKFLTSIILCLVNFIPIAHAAGGDLSISSGIRMSSEQILEGQSYQLYTSVYNNSNIDLQGRVKFFVNNSQIGTDQPVAVIAGSSDNAFVSWTPSTYGTQKLSVELVPWEREGDDTSNNYFIFEVDVLRDSDRDGVANITDTDDDNDGVSDQEDLFPLNGNEWQDTDGDGKGDNEDPDDDNDGVPDETDQLPLNPDESIDTDGDKIGNTQDNDDDNDGLLDDSELNLKTDPLKADTDGDGQNDNIDQFPLDPEEWNDHDQDGIGNNKDPDDDNDGTPDQEDTHPLNKKPSIKLNEEKNILLPLFKELKLDASNSIDEDGEVVSYLWETPFGKFEGKTFSTNFNQIGDYQIKLSIKDDYGEISTSIINIKVNNQSFLNNIILTLITTLLACLLIFKYIVRARN